MQGKYCLLYLLLLVSFPNEVVRLLVRDFIVVGDRLGTETHKALRHKVGKLLRFEPESLRR